MVLIPITGEKEAFLLIGICFDAPRFRENCFCVVFIYRDFAPSSARVNHFSGLFFGCGGRWRACLTGRSRPRRDWRG